MKKLTYSLALATALVATSCSDKDELINEVVDPNAKEMISFSMSDAQGPVTRATTRAGFEATTRIVMRIQSDDRRTSPQPTKYTRTVAEATAEVTKPGGFKCSDVTFSVENGLVRYWDDAYGRNSLLSVYAIAIPGKSGSASETLIPVSKLKEGNYTSGAASSENVKDWGSCADNTIAWGVTTTTQTDALIANEDLAYSNNIKQTGEKGVYWYDFTKSKHIPDLATAVGTGNDFKDGQMKFRQEVDVTPLSDAAGKFDKGHLDFNHALTRMTIQIIKGDGFDTAPFAFNSGNVKVLSVPTSGTLNIATGEWAASPTITDINVLSPQGSYSNAAGSYRAQFLPGYTFTNGDATNVLTFTIDNNTYFVTQDMLFDALTYDKDGDGVYDSGDGDGELVGTTDPISMAQGKNYVFKITVNKTEIKNITATLVPWVDVTAANENVYNSYVSLSLKSTSGESCENFDIYRLGNTDGNIHTTDANSVVLKNWQGNYTDKQTVSESTLSKATDYATSKKWTTKWFFEDNKTFYHFRTVKAGTTINTTPDKDNFVITSGAQASTDPHWGAPMVSGATLEYDKTEANDASGNTKEGYSSSIYKAIGSTTDDIKITEIHMMANVNIVLKTVTGDGAVKLFDDSKPEADKAAKITITQFANAGTVDMGTGFVRPTSPFTQNQLITSPGVTSSAYYKTVPTSTVAAVSNNYTWAIVPQALKRGNADADYIGITIQTPDANQYYVIKRLSEITADYVKQSGSDYSDPNQAVNDPITFWYPGHTYTYTFTISKKGIEAITCTVAPWIDVTAANKDITLED